MTADENSSTLSAEESEARAPREDTGLRRCVVTRNKAPRESMLRFVSGPEGELLFDVRQKAPGRGVYVSPRRELLDKALAGAMKRGFRGAVTLPSDERWVETHVVAALSRHYDELLSLGRKSGQLIAGANVVERASRDGKLVAYLLATDASPGTRKKYEQNAGRKEVPMYGLRDRQTLGRLIGRDDAVVLGWTNGGVYQRFAIVESQLNGIQGNNERT